MYCLSSILLCIVFMYINPLHTSSIILLLLLRIIRVSTMYVFINIHYVFIYCYLCYVFLLCNCMLLCVIYSQCVFTFMYVYSCFMSMCLSVNAINSSRNISWEIVVCPKKGTVCLGFGGKVFNRRIRTGYGLDASGRRQRPWLSRSSSWRARCR